MNFKFVLSYKTSGSLSALPKSMHIALLYRK